MSTARRSRSILAAALVLSLPAPTLADSKGGSSASGFDKQRIEYEDRFLVPPEKAEEVWQFLEERYVRDVEGLKKRDPLFTSYFDVEQFTDTYFDTPSLELLALQSGVRHRRRINVTNPNDRKSGRELMQIKLSGVSASGLERGEIKFPIEYPEKIKTAADTHPMLGIVKRSKRDEFVRRLEEIGLDPMAMKPIVTIHDKRTRIYILRDGAPFMSISHDQASAKLWWAETEFVEIEPELNEIKFTEATSEERRYMLGIAEQISAEIRERFPFAQRDLTPKYNKVFDRLAGQVPFLRLAVRAELLGLQ